MIFLNNSIIPTKSAFVNEIGENRKNPEGIAVFSAFARHSEETLTATYETDSSDKDFLCSKEKIQFHDFRLKSGQNYGTIASESKKLTERKIERWGMQIPNNAERMMGRTASEFWRTCLKNPLWRFRTRLRCLIRAAAGAWPNILCVTSGFRWSHPSAHLLCGHVRKAQINTCEKNRQGEFSDK